MIALLSFLAMQDMLTPPPTPSLPKAYAFNCVVTDIDGKTARFDGEAKLLDTAQWHLKLRGDDEGSVSSKKSTSEAVVGMVWREKPARLYLSTPTYYGLSGSAGPRDNGYAVLKDEAPASSQFRKIGVVIVAAGPCTFKELSA